MSPTHLVRLICSYASLIGAGLCLWQVPGLWERQLDGLRRTPTAWEDELRSHLVVVDAGHGGVDGGTQGHGVLEKHTALEIARRVEKHLRSLGIRTVMTRRDDTFVELEERCAIANRNAASAFVSIHLNADATSDDTAGIETYYSSRKRLGDLMKLRTALGLAPGLALKDERSAWLARTLQRDLCKATGANDRRARDSNYLVVVQAECPAVLIECGYLTNETESKRLTSEAYQEKIAASIAGSVRHFLLAKGLNPRRGIVTESVGSAAPTGSLRGGNP